MRRTPTEADLDILQFCGALGHRFVLVVDHPTMGRVSRLHVDEEDYARKAWIDSDGNPALFEQRRLKNGERRWRRVL